MRQSKFNDYRGYYRFFNGQNQYFLVSEIPLGIDSGRVYAEHTHDFHELTIIFSGAARHHVVNGQTIGLKAGDVFVFGSGDAHEIIADSGSLEICNIAFLGDGLYGAHLSELRQLPGFQALFLREPPVDGERRQRGDDNFAGKMHLQKETLQTVFQQVQAMRAEQESRRPGAWVTIQGLFLQLAVLLARNYAVGANNEITDPLVHRLDAAFAWMEKHALEPVTLAQLAQRASMCPRHFTRVFKEHYGQAPLQFLLRRRLERAMELLITGRSVTEAANAVGFPDSGHFANLFRRHVGCTPLCWQRQWRHRERP